MKYFWILFLLFTNQAINAQCGAGELVHYDGDDFSNHLPPVCEDVNVSASNMIFHGDEGCLSTSWCDTNQFYHCDETFENPMSWPDSPYIEFDLSPATIDTLHVTGIQIRLWSYDNGNGGTGAQEYRVGVSLDTGVTWEETADFFIDLGNNCGTGEPLGTLETWTLTNVIHTTGNVLFRIHMHSGTNSSNTLYETVLYEATVLGEILLPKEETNFHIKVLPSSVELRWNTFDYIEKYELERSGTNGIFTIIQEFDQSSQPLMSYSDLSPKEFNLYRLKLTDGDNMVSYSVVRKAELKIKQVSGISFTIYPSVQSPGSYFTLNYSSKEASTRYNIYDLEGKPVSAGVLDYNYDTHSIRAPGIKGMYFLQLQNTNNHRTSRFVVR